MIKNLTKAVTGAAKRQWLLSIGRASQEFQLYSGLRYHFSSDPNQQKPPKGFAFLLSLYNSR